MWTRGISILKSKSLSLGGGFDPLLLNQIFSCLKRLEWRHGVRQVPSKTSVRLRPVPFECSMKTVKKDCFLLLSEVKPKCDQKLYQPQLVLMLFWQWNNFIRIACELNAIRNVLQVNRSLVQSKMYGYEGSDVFEIIKNVSRLIHFQTAMQCNQSYSSPNTQSKSKRCYFYTGQEKDGFFYPLHVATEAGHKNLTILLVRAGADVSAPDYRYIVRHIANFEDLVVIWTFLVCSTKMFFFFFAKLLTQSADHTFVFTED